MKHTVRISRREFNEDEEDEYLVHIKEAFVFVCKPGSLASTCRVPSKNSFQLLPVEGPFEFSNVFLKSFQLNSLPSSSLMGPISIVFTLQLSTLYFISIVLRRELVSGRTLGLPFVETLKCDFPGLVTVEMTRFEDEEEGLSFRLVHAQEGAGKGFHFRVLEDGGLEEDDPFQGYSEDGTKKFHAGLLSAELQASFLVDRDLSFYGINGVLGRRLFWEEKAMSCLPTVHSVVVDEEVEGNVAVADAYAMMCQFPLHHGIIVLERDENDNDDNSMVFARYTLHSTQFSVVEEWSNTSLFKPHQTSGSGVPLFPARSWSLLRLGGRLVFGKERCVLSRLDFTHSRFAQLDFQDFKSGRQQQPLATTKASCVFDKGYGQVILTRLWDQTLRVEFWTAVRGEKDDDAPQFLLFSPFQAPSWRISATPSGVYRNPSLDLDAVVGRWVELTDDDDAVVSSCVLSVDAQSRETPNRQPFKKLLDAYCHFPLVGLSVWFSQKTVAANVVSETNLEWAPQKYLPNGYSISWQPSSIAPLVFVVDVNTTKRVSFSSSLLSVTSVQELFGTRLVVDSSLPCITHKLKSKCIQHHCKWIGKGQRAKCHPGPELDSCIVIAQERETPTPTSMPTRLVISNNNNKAMVVGEEESPLSVGVSLLLVAIGGLFLFLVVAACRRYRQIRTYQRAPVNE